MDLEPVVRDHDLFYHEPHDRLLGLEIRVVERRPELLDVGLGPGNLPGRQLLSRSPGIDRPPASQP